MTISRDALWKNVFKLRHDYPLASLSQTIITCLSFFAFFIHLRLEKTYYETNI